jgi:hypothetical protein
MHITLGQMMCGGIEFALGIADGPDPMGPMA